MRAPPDDRIRSGGGHTAPDGREGAAVVRLIAAEVTDAALDVSISHALLRHAARTGEETLRLWSPPPALSFGRLDLLLPGAPKAIAAARGAGLAPVKRLAGGRAAAVGPGTLAVGWASPASVLGPMDHRYAALAETLIEALHSLEIPARVGELDGEWCPGRWSILVGAGKVGGLAQRVIRGGAWAEAILVLEGSRELAAPLAAVQSALGCAWLPETLVAINDTHPGLPRTDVRNALGAALAGRWPVVESELAPELAREAHELRPAHDLDRAAGA